jgi:hypothetical protein
MSELKQAVKVGTELGPISNCFLFLIKLAWRKEGWSVNFI